MNIALSILLAAAVAIIFCLILVLKKTFYIMDSFLNGTKEEPSVAYNGIYYPATIINHIIFNSDKVKTIVDFSLYKEKNIICYILYSTDNCIEILKNPRIIKNAVVYEVQEGVWAWKLA